MGKGKKNKKDPQQVNKQMHQTEGNRNQNQEGRQPPGANQYSNQNNQRQNNMGGVIGNQSTQSTGRGRGRGAWGSQNSYNDSDSDSYNNRGHGGFYNPAENNYGMGNRSQSAPVSNEQEGTGNGNFTHMLINFKRYF